MKLINSVVVISAALLMYSIVAQAEYCEYEVVSSNGRDYLIYII